MSSETLHFAFNSFVKLGHQERVEVAFDRSGAIATASQPQPTVLHLLIRDHTVGVGGVDPVLQRLGEVIKREIERELHQHLLAVEQLPANHRPLRDPERFDMLATDLTALIGSLELGVVEQPPSQPNISTNPSRGPIRIRADPNPRRTSTPKMDRAAGFSRNGNLTDKRVELIPQGLRFGQRRQELITISRTPRTPAGFSRQAAQLSDDASRLVRD